MTTIETDYLVVGAGATGMAFTDELVTHSDAEIVLVDRRHRPGGHWTEGYGFLRLHQPSAFYGVGSRELGYNKIDVSGPNKGHYERATGAEVFDYYGRVLDEHMIPTGRVRFLGMSDYVGKDGDEHQVVSRVTGKKTTVRVRRKFVDATLLQTRTATNNTPSFSVDPAVRVVIPHELPKVADTGSGFTILGAGKTSMDTCFWLLGQGVDPEDITWIRPRDAWTVDRAGLQPLTMIGSFAEWYAVQMEAAAVAESSADFLRRLEESGGHQRLDPTVEPGIYRGANLNEVERVALRSIEDVVRLGRVIHIGADEIKLEQGSVPTEPRRIHVDCTAPGIGLARARPVFQPGAIMLQRVQIGIDPFSAALIGFVETTGDDDEPKNGLCRPIDVSWDVASFTPGFLASQEARVRWFDNADVRDWLARSRLTPLRNAAEYLTDPEAQKAVGRMIAATGPAIENLRRVLAAGTA